MRAERGFYKLQLACGLVGVIMGTLGLLAFMLVSPTHTPKSAVNAALGPSGFGAMLLLGVLIARSAVKRMRALNDRIARRPGPDQKES